jgi:excisionase family DNA binding protein
MEVLLTKKDVAARLSISPRHLENLIKRERLPLVRLGRSVRIPIEVFQKLASAGSGHA